MKYLKTPCSFLIQNLFPNSKSSEIIYQSIQQLLCNTRSVFSTLSPCSLLCRPLIVTISKRINQAFAANICNCSTRTILRATSENAQLSELKITGRPVQRTRKTKAFEVMRAIFDEILPPSEWKTIQKAFYSTEFSLQAILLAAWIPKSR